MGVATGPQVNMFEQPHALGIGGVLWLTNGIIDSGHVDGVPLPEDRRTRATENITIPQTTYVGGNYRSPNQIPNQVSNENLAA